MSHATTWSADAVRSVLSFNFEAPEASVLDHPLLRSIIAGSAAHLLEGEEEAEPLLLHIKHYLFFDKNLRDTTLRQKLPEDLYVSLYGLKVMMQNQNLQSVERQLKASKRRTLLWLEALQEEE